MHKAIDYIRNLKKILNDDFNDPNCASEALKSFNHLINSEEPTSTTKIDCELDDEDTENSGSMFDNDDDFLDETSQQSNEQLIETINQFATSHQTQFQSTELNQSDTNNNLINSNNAVINQLNDHQNLTFNSIAFDNEQNLVNYANRSQLPVQNLVNKENILYQNVSFKYEFKLFVL